MTLTRQGTAMYDQSTPIGEFLSAAAARQPTPGGGSITAIVGALAASMGEMAINYSLNKKGLEAYQEELKPALAELARSRELLLQLLVEDQSAFAALTAAKKLPDSNPMKSHQYSNALNGCIHVPQAMAAVGISILETTDTVATFITPWLLSDLAVCADLAMATVRCAIYNVRANLPEVKNPTDRASIESTIRNLLVRGAEIIQQVAPRIWQRHEQEVG